MSKSIKSRKQKISKEVTALSDGISKTIFVPIDLFFKWEDGSNGVIYDNLDDDDFVSKIEEYIAPHREEFAKKQNARIQAVCAESDKLAKELNQDPTEFFCQFI